MSYTLLGSNLPARKPQFNFQSQSRYESRYENRVIDDYAKLSIKQGLDIFSGVVYKNVLMNLHHAFSACRAAFDESINMSRSFEKQLYILLEKVFEIIEMQQLRGKVEAFDCFKYCLKIKRFSIPKQDLSYKIAIKNLATTSRVKNFRKALIRISKVSRINYQALKMRFFMNICQNYLTKNDKRKDLYLGFREWHLQTVIRNLSILSEDQNSLAYENRKFSIMNFHTVIMKHVQKVFFVLKNASAKSILLQRFFFSRLRLQEFIERTSRPFIQKTLISFPKANLSKKRINHIDLNGLAFAFSKLKKSLKGIKDEKNGKHKGIILLMGVLSKRLIQKYSFSFLKFNELKPQIDERDLFTENQNKAVEMIFSTVLQRTKKNYLAAFHKIFYCRKTPNPELFNKFLFKVGLNKLHILTEKPRLSTLYRAYFFRWRAEASKISQENIFIEQKFKTIQVKDALQSLVLKIYRDSFNKIHSSALETLKPQSARVITYHEDHNLLTGFLLNQAVVNRQLELRHQKKHDKTTKTMQQQALLKILLKAYQRALNNRCVTSRFLRRWQENISFRNAKVKEYNQYLEVLENENDLLTRDIMQIEQANVDTAEKNSFMRNEQFEPESPTNVSSKRIDLGRQIRYLEFLEIQNSNLMEILKTNEPDFEEKDEDVEEIQEEIYRRISRSYSF